MFTSGNINQISSYPNFVSLLQLTCIFINWNSEPIDYGLYARKDVDVFVYANFCLAVFGQPTHFFAQRRKVFANEFLSDLSWDLC